MPVSTTNRSRSRQTGATDWRVTSAAAGCADARQRDELDATRDGADEVVVPGRAIRSGPMVSAAGGLGHGQSANAREAARERRREPYRQVLDDQDAGTEAGSATRRRRCGGLWPASRRRHDVTLVTDRRDYLALGRGEPLLPGDRLRTRTGRRPVPAGRRGRAAPAGSRSRVHRAPAVRPRGRRESGMRARSPPTSSPRRGPWRRARPTRPMSTDRETIRLGDEVDRPGVERVEGRGPGRKSVVRARQHDDPGRLFDHHLSEHPSPPRTGISTSRVTTSGRIVRTISRPCSPLAASRRSRSPALRTAAGSAHGA
jgi:hypothetical protein